MEKIEERSSEIIAETKWSDILQIHWNYRVYIPKEYNENLDKKYPVLYVLHGWGGNVTNTTDETRIDSQLILDKLIKNNEIIPMIVVFIDGFNSFYVDGPTFKMKSAIINDLIPFIDSQYRTLTDKRNKAIVGISMGGFGALNIALSNINMFNSVGLMSPAIWDTIEENNIIYGSPLVDIYHENSYKKLMEDLKANDINIFAYHGKDDEIIPYKGFKNFISLAKYNKINIKYELQEIGPHNWETWRGMYPRVLKDVSNSFNK